MEREGYCPQNKLRFITATSLFDGHDAAINIFRRLLVDRGAEVIHLGHNRSAGEIVDAAVQEDVQAVAVSSYQGGHIQFYKYIYDLLHERGAGHIRIFGGGGGVIVPWEIKELEEYGITKIYSPEDGRIMGLDGIIDHMLQNADFSTLDYWDDSFYEGLRNQEPGAVARFISLAENLPEGEDKEALRRRIGDMIETKAPVVGITGTGGAGKSSLTDELMGRLLTSQKGLRIAVLSVDPTRSKTGGALLGDRIRMNNLGPRVYMRSLATRGTKSELSDATRDAVEICRAAGFDIVLLETSGIGQGDTDVVKLADLSIYVMTPEYGASMQLEKIDMLDYADIVAINKFERKGAEDALRDVRKQYRRNHKIDYAVPDEDLPVIGTIASRFNDIGVNALYALMVDKIRENTGQDLDPSAAYTKDWQGRADLTIIPRERENYLGEIARVVREYKNRAEEEVKMARRLFQVEGALEAAQENGVAGDGLVEALSKLKDEYEARLSPRSRELLASWDALVEAYSGETMTVRIRDREITYNLKYTTLSGTSLPRVALPKYQDYGERLRYLLLENVPGRFPFTAGSFPFKRTDEEPKRQFAGEGTPERTNRRFHFLTKDEPVKRLSTAFDSPTLYGEDPAERPDIFGKVGESGVSICTLDDMKKLYAGFDLCDPKTSVSMTINGPAPAILAMFFNTAIDQQIEKFKAQKGREPTEAERKEIRARVLRTVRGTVQADILKEDQGQNTCIFSIDFALRMMGDIQEFFVQNDVRNFYSVSISGYHIAEAGANPITQLAFTLANGFTYVEYYLNRGMKVNDFARNLSFFFSNGMDAEYSVLGRVARRIWAIAMKERYGADERSQKLKYHIQTSGRSLHAQEMAFNDIRTTLQALMAYYDNCNSLHTNAYDEAVTTPTEESVRRAMAIQLIISREFGLAKNENNAQGSFIMEELTDLVEEAVLAEFERINARGGVLGAMERGYQRGKIQAESMIYEMKKHTGELPIIGVNTFINPEITPEDFIPRDKELARATPGEKREQLANLRAFQERNQDESSGALERLKRVAREGGNIFAELMETVRYASLGQITHALYEIGGKYRRNM